MRNRYGAIDFSSRRSFLQAVGLGFAAAPFVPLTEAQSAPGAAPQRLLIMVGSNGVGDVGKFNPGGSGTGFTLPSTLAALEPHRQDLILFRDFAGRYASDEAGVHPMAAANLLTGSPATRPSGGTIYERQDATRATSISVDQFIAKAIGKGSRFESLVLGAGSDPHAAGDHIGGSVSYRAASDPVIAETDVFKTFDRVFADAANATVPGSDRVDVREGDGRSILDAIYRDLDRLRGRVGAEDLRRLDSHLESVRSLEKRLHAMTPEPGGGTTPSAGCAAPPMPPRDDKAAFNVKAATRFLPQIVQAQVDLTLAAMACDLTRVALFQVGVTTALWPPDFMGLRVHLHDISHKDVPNMTRYTERTIRDGYAYLLTKLKAVKEGAGSLLDSSAAIWANEFSDGARHQGSPLPIIAAGKAGGKWQTGRLIAFGRRRRHTDFLVSLCRTFGLEVSKFGTDPTEGPIAELGV